MFNFCLGITYDRVIENNKGRIKFFTKKETCEKKNSEIKFSCVVLNKQGELIDHLYSPDFNKNLLSVYGLPPGQKYSKDRALTYLDQKFRDTKEEEVDKKIILISLKYLSESVSQIIFFLNCQDNDHFGLLLRLRIRLYTLSSQSPKMILAEKEIDSFSNEEEMKSFIFARFYREEDKKWKFTFNKELYPDSFIGQTIFRILQSNLK